MPKTQALNPENERFLEMWEWVKKENDVKSDTELLAKLGYTSRSAISIIKAGRPVAGSLINSLCDNYGVSRRYIKEGSLPKTNTGENIGETEGQRLRMHKAIGQQEDEGLIYVPIKAQAGYAQHYTEPLYLEQLEKLYIPNNPYKGGHFRFFEVEGDSMSPTLEEGMQVIGQRIEPESWTSINEFYIHVIVTDSQILIKRLAKVDAETFAMISDNEDIYPQIELPITSIKELWVVKRMLDWRMSAPKRFEVKINKKKP